MAAPIPFGPYLLLDRIGVGARSEVFRARLREGSGGEVALKRVQAGAAHDAETRRVFFAEAELVSRLDHPGIARALDHGLVADVPYATYELVRGRDLETLVSTARARGATLSVGVAFAIVERLLEALSYLHTWVDGAREKPILHRDVTPSNVLVGYDGGIKLIDFGIAKVEGRNTTTGVGEIKGTIRYMSPEQMLAEELDPRSDLYPVGVLLYELLTGQTLFEGMRPVQILEEVSRGGVPEVAHPSIPAELATLLRKVLAHRRAERYDTAAHLLEALRALSGRMGSLDGAEGTARLMAELFSSRPGAPSTLRPARMLHDHESVTPEEPSTMAEEKGGSDLDVFEGLAKKSQRSPSLPGPPPGAPSAPPPMPPSGPPSKAPPLPNPSSALPPPSGRAAGNKSTLLGVPALEPGMRAGCERRGIGREGSQSHCPPPLPVVRVDDDQVHAGGRPYRSRTTSRIV